MRDACRVSGQGSAQMPSPFALHINLWYVLQKKYQLVLMFFYRWMKPGSYKFEFATDGWEKKYITCLSNNPRERTRKWDRPHNSSPIPIAKWQQ